MTASVPQAARIAIRSWQGVAFAGLAAYAAQAAVAICGAGATGFFETYVYTGLIFVGASLCLTRAAIFPHERLAWLAFGIGLVSWGAGEVYYTVALEQLVDPPLPSIADALWLAFYPASYVGLVLLIRSRVRHFPRSIWLDGAVGALTVAALGAALVAGPITTGPDATIVAVDLSYLLGDLLLLGFVVGIFAVTGWRPGTAFGLLGAGLVASAIVDGYFLHQLATGALVDTTLVATLWPAAALLVGCAAWASPTGRTVRLDGVRVLVMPALFGVIGLGVLVVHAIEPVHPLALGLAVAAIAATIARLGVTFRENLRLLEGTTREAYTDSLTSLGNRRRLMEDLAQAAADATPAEPCGLVVFDLDGFKQYNDRYGHPMGDALLGRLGHRLDAAVRGVGRAYRLGGDEFCVIGLGTKSELSAIAGSACDALSERGRGFDVGCSHGLVLMPEEAMDVTHALHVADERLYEQKGSRRREVVSTETSSALVQVLREYEPDLHGHLSEVMRLSRSVGQRLGLDESELFDVIRAAELHDIGKVAVPSTVLQKDGPLDESEWDFVRQHTLVGDRILSAAPALANVAKLVRASHERYDGMGYPDQTSGNQIPIGARIVAVCDAYHAMTSDRPYRPRLEGSEALTELRRCAGAQFDPQVVQVFCELMETQVFASQNGPDPAGTRTHRLDPRT